MSHEGPTGRASVVPIGTGAGPLSASDRLIARSDRRFLLAVLAVASGIGAAFASGSPTPFPAVDGLLRALVGVATVLAASIAPWPLVLVSTALVLAGSFDGPVMVIALVALLAVAGSVAYDQARQQQQQAVGLRKLALRCAAGGLIAQAALRLSWPRTPLLTALLGGVAVLLLVLPALRRCPTPARRWVQGVSGALLLAAVALTVLAGLAALSARAPLAEAIATSESGLSAVAAGEEPSAATDFANAAGQFARASSDLGIARWAQVVPGVSQQVRALGVAATEGRAVALAARATTEVAASGALELRHGSFPLRAIHRLGQRFLKDERALSAAIVQTRRTMSPWLITELSSKIGAEMKKLRHARRDAARAAAAARVVPALLGADGPKRYLVLFENPAESRASGGVVGAYAQLDAVNGHLSLARVGSNESLNTAGHPATRHLVAPAGYLDRYSQFQPQEYWQNVPMSPDFPSVGDVAAHLYPQSGGVPVDGVISLDPLALQSLMSATDSLTVPDWPSPITSGDVVADLAHQEFIQFAGDNSARTAFVTGLVHAIWHRLVSGPLPSIPLLASELKPAIAGHHVLLYSPERPIEQFFKSVHVAGAMPSVHSDFLGVVTQNAAGNKLDWYLRRTIRYRATLHPLTHEITASVTVRLRNLSPSRGLPPMILDPSPGAQTSPGENELYVSIYTPWSETSAQLDGRPLFLTTQQELHRFVYSGFVRVPPHSSVTLVVHLTGPWNRPISSYHLSLYKQPVLFPDRVVTSLRVG